MRPHARAVALSCKFLTIARANCAVDSYEFTALPDVISVKSVEPSSDAVDENNKRLDARAFDLNQPYEHKPHFHEWATALPGMICVSRKARNSTFRNYVAAETATPVSKKASKANWCYPLYS